MFGEVNLTLDVLSQIVGIALSLLFTYAPGASDWFESLETKYKPLVMMGINLVVLAVLFGVSCASWLSITTCDVNGVAFMLRLFVQAMIANQTTYVLTRKAHS